MSWYKVEFNSGPGHQSHHVYYGYTGFKLDDDLKQELFDQHSDGYDWPIGKVVEVKKLPEEVHKAQIEIHKARIETSKKMLKILAKTPRG